MPAGQVGSTNGALKPLGSNPAGRPFKYSQSKFTLRPLGSGGYTMANTDPDIVGEVKSLYLDDMQKKRMPAFLQPNNNRWQQNAKNRNISKGMRG